MNLILDFRKRFLPVVLIICTFIAVNTLLRIVLMFYVGTKGNINFWHYPVALLIGFLYDVASACFVAIPFVLYVWLQNEIIYSKKIKPFVFLVGLLCIGVLLFTNIIPSEFNKLVYNLLTYYIVFRFALYCIMAIIPFTKRQIVRVYLMSIMLFITINIIIFNAVSEWFFWEEFSTRYNFIAVDYLIYTNEVIGNIKESYPIGWLIAAIVISSSTIIYLWKNELLAWVQICETIKKRSIKAIVLLALPVLVLFFLPEKWHRFSNNEYSNELAANGSFQFATAFSNNELDFFKFYQTLPDTTAFTIMREQLKDSNNSFTSNNIFNLERKITASAPPLNYNVVLISIESLSASYMAHFGSTSNITPHLDSLADKSIFFTGHYASGTRTVRGLEALTLSLPPVPGQSIVKRPDNANLFTLGSVFKTKGYTTQYIYGGYSYFDNMKNFFGNNGYDVIDRTAIKDADIHYQNVWGVADEDEFTLAIQTLDKNYELKKPFFTHIMTVSNHRPFTYPDGRINIPSTTQSRNGAVKYTDYCINKFIKEASAKPWYNQTIFVIVSDHCAGSAGSVALPVTGYHIPLLIFAPAICKPAVIPYLTAQIDIAPTILGMLNFTYNSKFFGKDIFHSDTTNSRAFVSTYQGLGFIKNGQLIIQSPVKKVNQYLPNFITGAAIKVALNDTLMKQAISQYQTAAWLIKNKKYTQ